MQWAIGNRQHATGNRQQAAANEVVFALHTVVVYYFFLDNSKQPAANGQ
jgi:hypothetical protein